MSDKPPPANPPASPVESATPVSGGKPPLSPVKIGLIIVACAAVLMEGPRAFNWIRDATHSEPKQVAPAAAGPGQKYMPPEIPGTTAPKVTNAAVTVPPMPIESQGAQGQRPMDPRIAARLSDIGGGGGSATPPAPPGEHPPAGPLLPGVPVEQSPLSKSLTP